MLTIRTDTLARLVWLPVLLLWLAACQQPPSQLRPTSPPAGQALAPIAGTTSRVGTAEAATPSLATTTAGAVVPAAGPDVAFLPAVVLPPAATVPPPAPPATTPDATPAFAAPQYQGPAVPRGHLGVQVHLHRADIPALVGHLRRLNVGWVKVQVSWKLFEPAPGRFDEVWFGELDWLVTEAHAADIAILLSVAKAPEWSRPTTEMDGPPADLDHFRSFMRRLAERYPGRIAAYELWNEPNLRREWNGAPLDPARLVALMAAGADGIREVDGAALLVSGSPAPTGIDDGRVAVDDRRYLAGMLAAGAAGVVDAIGVHPYGWANPARASVARPDPAATSHNNHPSFFFRDTLEDYRALLVAADAADRPLWATEFGWGSFGDLGAAPPPEAAFMNDVSPEQQAAYTLEAIALAQEWPWMGPMFLWNLNFAPRLGPALAESGYSLLDTTGAPRPVYHALLTLRWADE